MVKGYGFIGAGQMARALACGFTAGGLVSDSQIVVADPVPAATEQFLAAVGKPRIAESNAEVVELAEVIILAVKPQAFPGVAAGLKHVVTEGRLFVSILAGVPLATLTEQLGTDRVIRVMPNTPCLVGAGAAAYSLGAGALPEDGQAVAELLGCVGLAIELDEIHLDAVTGLSGSGPAYVYTMIEALSDGGVRMGLPRNAATLLAAQTVLGSARMVLETGDHPGCLRDQVTSPGGTTISGLQVLEQRSFRAALMDAVQAATERSKELGRT